MRLENTTPFAANFTLALDKQGHEVIVLVVRGHLHPDSTRAASRRWSPRPSP
jgi:hypothetical protein